MPDSGMNQFPFLNPTQENVDAYTNLQRKQMLTQALMSNFQQSSQNPAEWNSMRVVPKRSALANVATLASGLLAGKAQNDTLDAQNNYYRGLMGGSSPSATSPAAPSSTPSPIAPLTPELPPTASQPGLLPPTQPVQPGPSPAAPAAAAAPQQPHPMLLTGDPQTSQALFSMMGPQEYAKALAGRYAPTDMEKMLHAAGIDPASPQGQAALRANVNKANYIPPVQAREGSTLVGADGKPTFYNPKVAPGSMPQFGQNGMPTSVTQIPGAAGAAETNERAQTLGKTEGQYNVLPTGGGGSTVVGGPGMPSPGGTMPPTPTRQGAQAPRVAQPGGAPKPAGPSGGPWDSMPKLPVSSAIGAPDEFTKGRLQEAGKKDAELSGKYGAEADLADQKQQYNAQAIAALPASETGPLSSWLTEHRAALKEAGVPENLIPASGTVTPTLELNKYLKNAALQGARQIYGARMTQMEVKLQTDEMSPSPAMTRDAIASLIQQDNIRNGYAKQRAEDYGKYVEGKGDPLRFESWYHKRFPLTDYAKSNPGAAPNGAAPGATPKPADIAGVRKQFSKEEIAAELKRRGIGG